MSAARHLGPVRHVEGRLGPRPRRDEQLLREDGAADRRLDVAQRPARRRVARLVVDARRRRDRLRRPVDGDVRQQLVLRELALDVAVAVAPGPELLDDPRGQPRRRVVQAVAQGLRLGPLDVAVAPLVGEELLPLPAARQFLGRDAGGRILHAGRRARGHHVQVHPDHPVGMLRRLPAADDAAPVAPLRAVALVAEPLHQLADDPRHPLRVVAAAGRLVGEAVPGDRRRHHVEGVGRVAAVVGRIDQQRDDLVELHDRAGPAVGDHQRQRVLVGRPLVDEVDVQPLDVRLEVVEAVQQPLLAPPVEFVPPVGEQLLQVLAVGAVVPRRAGQVVGEPRPGQAVPQVGQHFVGHVDRERADRLGIPGRVLLLPRRRGGGRGSGRRERAGGQSEDGRQRQRRGTADGGEAQDGHEHTFRSGRPYNATIGRGGPLAEQRGG